MKIMIFLRNKAGAIVVTVLIGCLALTAAMTSCQKEEQAQEQQTSAFLEECRAFYESHAKGNEAFSTNHSEQEKDNRPFLRRTPRWEHALTRSISLGQSVAVPLNYEGLAFARSSVNSNDLSMEAISYLLVYKDKKKAMHAEIVYIFHDAMETGTRESTSNGFFGVVYTEDLNGNFIKGFRVLPPKYSSAPVQPESQSLLPSSASKGEPIHTKADCFVVEYYTMCSLDGGITWGTPRLTSTRIECNLNVFANESDGGGGGSEDYLPSGGGGGGVTPPAPRTLTTSETSKLTSTRTDLSKDCATNNALSMVWGGLNFKMDAAINSPAQYNPFTNTLTFKSSSDINVNSTIEELFHAYQNATYPGGTTAYTRGKPGYTNIEFEAKVFKDIYAMTYGGMTSGSANFPETLRSKYDGWIFDIVNQGLTSSLLSRYSEMLGYFNTYSSEYGGYLLISLSNATAVIKSKSGCN